MTRLARGTFCCIFLLVGACATNVNDVRLESIRPIAAMQFPNSGDSGDDPRRFGGVVAEFSSAWDWRRQVARFGLSFFAVVERCAGRTHIDDPSRPRQWISHGQFVDELGTLAQAGRGSSGDPRRLSPVAGVPRNGRFYFLLPIHLEGYATERPNNLLGWETRRLPDLDLPRAPDDLCVFARGWTVPDGIWSSNTVVIPYADIRAALDASPAREPFADPPSQRPSPTPR